MLELNNWHMKPRIEIVGAVRTTEDLLALNLTKGSMSKPSGVAVKLNVNVSSTER
jgi:hypothetical protein